MFFVVMLAVLYLSNVPGAEKTWQLKFLRSEVFETLVRTSFTLSNSKLQAVLNQRRLEVRLE